MSSHDESSGPPAGEDIHLPPGSLQPLALTVGVTLSLLGLTHSVVMLIVGIIIIVWTLTLWIRDARAEYRHLPAHAGGHDGDAVAQAGVHGDTGVPQAEG